MITSPFTFRHMTDFLTHKLISFLVLAVIGTCIVIYRKIRSASDKRTVERLILSIRNHNRNAVNFAETLDIPYGKKEAFSGGDFDKLKAAIQATTKIDDYSVLYHTSIDAFRYLLITEVKFSDFDIGTTGAATDINKTAYHSFVLRFDPTKEILSVYSDLLFLEPCPDFRKKRSAGEFSDPELLLPVLFD